MYQIPALEWDEKIIVGDISTGSDTILNVPSTSEIVVGQTVYAAGIPFGATVLSKTPTTIVLSEEATATTVGLSVSFYTRFNFRYPAKKDEGEQLDAFQTKSKSLSGIIQTVTNHIEVSRDLEFDFITKAEKDILIDNFFVTWALYGNEFRYLNDKEVNSIIVYENDNKKTKTKRTVKKHPDYLYSIEFNFRRVL